MEHRYCVIMAGGIGSRFWPISRESKPKQFLDIMNTGRTFLQMTYDRLSPIIPSTNFVIVTSVQYKDLCYEQLPEIPRQNILCEPCRRNTAPCVCYAAYFIQSRDPNASIIVAPSDHLIMNVQKFQNVVLEAFDFIEKNNTKLMTLGMTPTRPETGYGYIKYESGFVADSSARIVQKFVEKPDRTRALEYLASGDYAWNAGIFLWTAKAIIFELQKHCKGVAECFEEIKMFFNTDSEVQKANEAYGKCQSISIDYAVMEKSDQVCVICSEFGWSDVGTWGSLFTLKEKDEKNNVSDGAQLYNCDGCIVKKPEGKYVVVHRCGQASRSTL